LKLEGQVEDTSLWTTILPHPQQGIIPQDFNATALGIRGALRVVGPAVRTFRYFDVWRSESELGAKDNVKAHI
jgi:hypothetical protein